MGKLCAAIALWLLCPSYSLSQPAYARELWANYNNAPDFTTKKEAFNKLERFYRVYHLDSALLICNQFREVTAQNQADYVPFVDLRIAGTYTRQLEFEKAGDILVPMLDKAEREHNDSLRAGVLLNLSNLNRVQKNFGPALQRAFQAAELHKKLQKWRDLCADYTAIANVYSASQKDSALLFLQKALAIAEQHNLLETQGPILNNIGVYFHRKGDVDQAISYYKNASVHDRKADDRFGLCFTLLNIGHAYRKQKKWAEAKPWYDDALPVCESCGNIEGVGSINLGLADMYEAQGDYKAALEAQKKINECDGQLHRQSYSRATQTLEAKYGSEKKERQLGEQRAENFRQRVGLFSLAAALLAFLVLAYLFYNRFRLRKQAELDAAVIREQQLGLNAVIEAQEAERKRIAKDLHDGIAQELVALKLGFNALQQRLSGSDTTQLDALAQQLDSSCTEIRNIAHGMMPPMLEQKGLAPSLEMLLRNSLQPAGIRAEFEQHGLTGRLDEKLELGLYRIAQELLNNIVKHAEAGRVNLQLYKAGANLVMKMEDDGKGYDFETAKAKGSMGLLNILSRVRALNGVFFAEPAAPHGSVATVRVAL